MKKKNLTRLSALLLTTAFSLNAPLTAAAAAALPRPTVDEAYYCLLDCYGGLKEASVVKTYSMNGATEIIDHGSYDSVRNLTNGTAASEEKGTVRFNFADNAPQRFSFEGKTSAVYEKLPWTISVSYRMNGVPKRAEEMAGEKGVAEIIISAVPNPEASDYARCNYTLSAVSVFGLNDILSLEAPDAELRTVGNLRAAAFVWLPGEEKEYSMRIGTDSFEFDGLTFLMGPLNSGRLSVVSDLRKDKEEVEDSFDKLNAAADEVLDSVDLMKESLGKAADGLENLNKVRANVYANRNALSGTLDAFLAELEGLGGHLKPLSGHLDAANNTVNDLHTNLSALDEAMLRMKEHLKETSSTLRSLSNDMVHLQDVTGDLDHEVHNLRHDIQDLRELASEGSDVVNMSVSGTLKQMGQLYAAYSAYAKAQGFEPMDAIGDGEVIYDLQGDAAVGTSSNASRPLHYSSSGLLDINGLSYPEGSFQDFAMDQMDAMGYDSEQIAYAISLWNYRKQVSSASAGAGAAYSTVDGLLESTLDLDLSGISDVLFEIGEDGETGFKQAEDLTVDLTDSITALDNAYKAIDAFHPELETAITDTSKVCASLSGMTLSLAAFLRTTRNLARNNRDLANAGTEKTLSGTASLLRESADAAGSTGKMRDAKDSIHTLIDDRWNEYTGEKSTLFLMDPDAAPESLTSPVNKDVTSVSVLIRTEEISIPDNEEIPDGADHPDDRSIFGRIVQMFRDIWNFLTGWMHN